MSRFIYADHAATTALSDTAVKAMAPYFQQQYGNPSSLYRFAQEAKSHLEQARAEIAACLGARPEEIYFTSGGTEADNWAVGSSMERMGKRGKHVVTTAVEHHAVLNPVKRLEERGFAVTYLEPDASGRIGLEDFKQALRPDTVFVSVMMVNNESGAVMPVGAMAKWTRRLAPQAIFHTDAVQGFLKVPFQAGTLGADLISVSSHKIHGPKGAGALYVRRGLSLPPFLLGGGQEGGYRSGTEAVPAVVGFGAACAAALPTLRRDLDREAALRDRCAGLLEEIPGVQVLGAREAPHILLASIPGVPVQNTINILQDLEICVSAGSACAKGHRSHVLQAMKLPPEVIDGAFRISLSRFTTPEEVDRLAEGVRAVVRRMKP